MSACSAAPAKARVLIVGTGLTGSLTCYHLRRLLKTEVCIDVTDMARGAGGRMSTTRFGDAGSGTRANTGAQYVSCCSDDAAALLKNVCADNGSERKCGVDLVPVPERRSTHFLLGPDSSYAHLLPHDGTNALVKQFLYAGEPDAVGFESRLQRVAASAESGMLLPLFDRGGQGGTYCAVVLAMPPKDILKLFDEGDRHDPQSQADLHRRFNRGRGTVQLPPGFHPVALPHDVQRRLRSPSFVGRYSLALWFDDGEGGPFLHKLSAAWRERCEPHRTIDLVSQQPGGVLVVQSTVEFWKQPNVGWGGGMGGRGGSGGKGGEGGKGGKGGGGGKGGRARGGVGGREAARVGLVTALEELAGIPMPRARHAKLLNWRTSQADRPLRPDYVGEPAVVTAHGGKLVFTGDWCVESSFEGCNRAALAAAAAAKDAVTILAAPVDLAEV